jgi:hypothetical protein
MTKRTGAGARSGAAATPTVAPPRTIDLLGVAMVVTALAALIRALVLFGYQSQLYQLLIDNNAKASAKTKKAHYVGDAVLKDLHSFRTGSLIQALMTAAVILVLAYLVRKTRVATGARWAILIVLVLFQIPLYILPSVSAGLPWPNRVATFVMGLAGVATLLLLFLPTSSAYFRACRAATMPAGAAARPGGLGSLFGPRRPAGAPAPAPRSAAAEPKSSQEAGTAQVPSRAKAKVRSDSEAVARGAELARTRAKASKTRRAAG